MDATEKRDPRARDRGPAARRRPRRTSRLIVVGLFVLMTGLLFALGLFMIGDRRALFARDFEVYTEFARLGGLQQGAIVRVAGADAGEVVEIRVPRSPREKFRLKLRLLEDLHGLVRTDSVASIQADGLVGNKFVQVEAGTEAAPQAQPGATIRGTDLYDFTDLLKQASDTMTSVADLVGQVRTSVNVALGGVIETTDEAKRIMRLLEAEFRTLTSRGKVVMDDVGGIVRDLRAGKGTAGKLLNDSELYDRANTIMKDAQVVVAKVNDAAEQAKQLVTEMRSNSGPVQGAIADLRSTLAGAREMMADLAENSEALKRNFFFRGFFERRGYYDLDDIPVDDYRAGALESRDRRVTRVWLKASLVFTTNADGEEVLSDAGRARIESAISEFLALPPDAPLVVEGYAVAPTYDARHIISRRRARLVRDYVISRTTLDQARVGVMPLGVPSADAPGGAGFEGIAIAAFIRTR